MEDFNDPIASRLDRITRQLVRPLRTQNSSTWRRLKIKALRGRFARLSFPARRELATGFIHAQAVMPLALAGLATLAVAPFHFVALPLAAAGMGMLGGAAVFTALPFIVAALRCLDHALAENPHA